MVRTKVHVGCGYNKLAGWVNVDVDQSCRPDVVADLRQGLPFKTESVDFIHSEDFIDQLDLGKGYLFLKECHRVLKKKGVMRVLTPDLYQFAGRYVRRDPNLLRLWDERVGLPLKTRTLCEMFNQGMKLGGRAFMYDEEALVLALEQCGFRARRVSYQVSSEEVLTGLDLRAPEASVSLYYECWKDDSLV